jgi:hypothetical protein
MNKSRMDACCTHLGHGNIATTSAFLRTGPDGSSGSKLSPGVLKQYVTLGGVSFPTPLPDCSDGRDPVYENSSAAMLLTARCWAVLQSTLRCRADNEHKAEANVAWVLAETRLRRDSMRS